MNNGSVFASFKKRNKFFCGTLTYFIFSLVIYIGCRLSEGFATFISEYPSAFFRFILAGATSIFPFSIAEALLLLLIPACIIFLFFYPDTKEGRFMTRNSYIMLGVLILVISLFISVFAPCYFRKPVEKELNLNRTDIKKEEIYNLTISLFEEISNLENDITSCFNGKTLMPLTYTELVEELNTAYEKLSSKHEFLPDFHSRPKTLAISKLMPYTRVSGFYTFFTGEANVSTAYPDFILPFTTAHEMAHQRGIAREDEANFIAFLACMESDHPYVKYSGYVETLNYLLDSLYLADYELFEKAYTSAPGIYKSEYAALISFYRGTESSSVSNVTSSVNDTMLQSQGQSSGSKSYNLMTELAVAYFSSGRNSGN